MAVKANEPNDALLPVWKNKQAERDVRTKRVGKRPKNVTQIERMIFLNNKYQVLCLFNYFFYKKINSDLRFLCLSVAIMYESKENINHRSQKTCHYALI